MKKIFEKFGSKKGASLALALLFMLVCMFTGAAILASGSSTSAKIDTLQTKDQSMYTLSSAADYLAHNISGKSFIYNPENSDYSLIIPNDITLSTDQLAMGNLVKGLANEVSNQLYSGSTVASATDTLSMEIVGGDEHALITPIKAVLTMKQDYSLTVVITLKDQEKPIVILEFDAAPYENIDAEAEIAYARQNSSSATKIPLSVTWFNPQIYMGGAR